MWQHVARDRPYEHQAVASGRRLRRKVQGSVEMVRANYSLKGP